MLEESIEYFLLLQVGTKAVHKNRLDRLQFRQVMMKVIFECKLLEDSSFPSQLGLALAINGRLKLGKGGSAQEKAL